MAEALDQKVSYAPRFQAALDKVARDITDTVKESGILEESSKTAEGSMMSVFNNLVLYDQHVPQNSLESIRPDLATDWSWDEDRAGPD